MPKKAKKGKGKGKGKKGGKKGKGKKEKKKNSQVALASANAKLWETRLDITEKSRLEYKDNAKKLMVENDALSNQMQQTEKDTIDVITFLRKQDQDKDDQIEKLHQQIKDLKRSQKKEKQDIINDLSNQINMLEDQVKLKSDEVVLMQSELKLVKEFRRKRGQMQKELDEIKESMHVANRDHKGTLTKMEQKFFEEKMRLQQEANQKIAELAEKAHTEAIANLDETTRSVYKENVRVSEALNYHMREGDQLKKIKHTLDEENETLKGDKELNEMMIQEKVVQSRNQKHQIKELQAKVETLETALSHMAREFEVEKDEIIHTNRIHNESTQKELVKLQRMVELKNREMNKVKRLARNILDQRTEMERFFLDSLEHVKMEIAANQTQYRKDAQLAYQQKMLTAHVGKGNFPKIRTFNKSDTSTNSVFKDLEAAERLLDLSGKVDVADLTWEQKERVLRYLFAKMNGAKDTQKCPALPPIQQKQLQGIDQGEGLFDDPEDATFLTQAGIEDDGGIRPLLPMIPHAESQSELTVS
ncbi:basal body-orientation factor 1-like [Lineus longissimus]|uniref:basal body-orientation factor 1-like n=1 Tax=Lineus longissimus TaxID=88925 RepID=UPI002B4F9E18